MPVISYSLSLKKKKYIFIVYSGKKKILFKSIPFSDKERCIRFADDHMKTLYDSWSLKGKQ